jgi:hypothetical protein
MNKGVSITKHIIEKKCGFINTVGNNYIKDDFRIWFDVSGVYFFYQKHIRLKIKYVHQLQSLVYLFTGSELEIV